jgi:phthalate 4,5-dioxygenase
LSDRMVILTRRVLLRAAREYRATGKLPELVDHPELARQASGGDIVVPAGTDWLAAYETAMTATHGLVLCPEAAE